MSGAATWVAQHTHGAPAALEARVRDVLASTSAGAVADPRGVSHELIGAAAVTLRTLLQSGPMTRAHALDLLTADALVTYAFEAAADDPTTLAERADDALRRIASIADDEAPLSAP